MNPGSTARRLLPAVFLLLLVPVMSHSQENSMPQTLTFSGYTWMVRQTTQSEGPMDNYFGGRDLSVFLNDDGSLTLKISPEAGIWHAGEVTSQKFMGYGTYVFKVRTPPADLDPNVVLGLFTYSRASAYSHREIDIEFSAWGQNGEPVLGQYVIQPYANPGHMIMFDISKISGAATYSFAWLRGKNRFRFLGGLRTAAGGRLPLHHLLLELLRPQSGPQALEPGPYQPLPRSWRRSTLRPRLPCRHHRLLRIHSGKKIGAAHDSLVNGSLYRRRPF